MAAAPKINTEPTYRDIDRSVLRVMEPAGRAYWAWIGFCFTLVGIAAGVLAASDLLGIGRHGPSPARDVGDIHYQLRFLGRYRALGNVDLRDPISISHQVAHRSLSRRGDNDYIRSSYCGTVPINTSWRVWFFYWLLPYPNERSLQPDFRSPLVWDAFAVSTYLTISALFWTMGLIPDIANAREAATGWRKKFYTVLAMGWQGTDRQWRHYSMAYLLMAGLATPLVLSVHSVVSWDFAMAINPGWHSTIFAPYFVAGAIFSGVAMVITLLIPMRRLLGIEDLLTEWHFDNLAKVVLLTSLVVSYAYITEAFMTWYAGDPIEQTTFHMRYFGPWGWMYWVMVLCNCVIPLLLFSPRIRVNLRALWVITIFVNIGMWFERFVIIAGSLTANFEPSQWASYRPSITEIMITVGSFAWFLGLFSLFSRFLPIISMTELKEGIVWLRKALKMDRVKAA